MERGRGRREEGGTEGKVKTAVSRERESGRFYMLGS